MLLLPEKMALLIYMINLNIIWFNCFTVSTDGKDFFFPPEIKVMYI